MSNTSNQGTMCKTVCWLFGIAAGGYLAFTLVNDYAQDQIQSAVIGIVAMLLVGLVLRRMFCNRRGDRVKTRIEEAQRRKAAAENEDAGSPVVAETMASVTAAATSTQDLEEADLAEPVSAPRQPTADPIPEPSFDDVDRALRYPIFPLLRD